MHEITVNPVESGDIVENITPKIEIIPLMDDPTILTKIQLGAAIYRRAWPVFKYHLHLPLKENVGGILCYREDVHIELLAAPG